MLIDVARYQDAMASFPARTAAIEAALGLSEDDPRWAYIRVYGAATPHHHMLFRGDAQQLPPALMLSVAQLADPAVTDEAARAALVVAFDFDMHRPWFHNFRKARVISDAWATFAARVRPRT